MPYTRNKIKARAADARYKARNKALIAERDRRYRGIPIPTRPAPERCECCDRKFAGQKYGPCVDHNHETGEFRGWLCHRCNLGIGLLGDSEAGAQKAVTYFQNSGLLS